MSRWYETEDEAYDRSVQEMMDDETEAREMEAQRIAAMRVASGISTEQLSLQDARIEGAKAGRMGHGPYSNPYQDFTPEHAEWEKSRHAAIGQKLNNPFANRRVA